MASSKYRYSITITNSYLRLSKEIKGATPFETEQKAREQIRKWKEQEKRQRERQSIADLKAQAEYDTRSIERLIDEYKNILKQTISIDDRLDWESLKEKTPFLDKRPVLNEVFLELQVPTENKLIEFFLKSRKEKRRSMVAQAQLKFNERFKAYTTKENEFYEKQKEQNQSVDHLKEEFELGHGDAIEKYVLYVLQRSQYPEGLEREFDVQYEPISKTIIIDFEFPSQESVPRIKEYKYVASRKTIDTVEMKQKEFDEFYERTLYQICLRTIHEIFEAVYIPNVERVVFNGWVNGIDRKTGKEFHSCIISCQAYKDEFEELNLAHVEPKECFRHLRGISAGPLNQLAPVPPILLINREDSRFVESREVLAHIDSTTNLATMDWEDFEHLVRELFSRVFSREGAEVKVTQASRDGGVDAIAFDPDPIRGGKIVIQAKRYNHVVPIASVRELESVVRAEGANKGILVTTSYFGRDSIDFAQKHPITLIDGSNLVYMFQEYGHNVTIQLNK